MNKSEIAEKAAREIEQDCVEGNAFGDISFEVSRATAIIERAIAESQAQPKIRWRTGKCEQDTRPHLENGYHICHNWRAELGDGEPSPPPKVGGVYTGLRAGCESDPSGLHECGVEENHKLCVCANCGANWPNPEWHGAAQVSPPSPVDWKKLAPGKWFFDDSPNCTNRYSVQERTASGCTLVCSTPWHYEGAKWNMQEIAESHNRGGDTRELKAAIKDSTRRMEQLLAKTDDHEDVAQIYRARISENKRLLG